MHSLYTQFKIRIMKDILQNKRAGYGKQVIAELSLELSKRYGRGFSKRNLRKFMKFNELYCDIRIVETLSAQFSWSHICSFLYIDDNLKREFYIQMA